MLDRWMAATVFGLGTLALGACGGAPFEADDRIERVSSSIVNGAPSAIDGVGLVHFSGDWVCTGFLASPNVVVTQSGCFNNGREPIAFYTGPGTAVAEATEVPTAANLTKFTVKAFGKHPEAVALPDDGAVQTYNAVNDVAFVVLDQRAAGTPLPYGAVATSGTCVTVGYGRNSTKYKQGTLGLRREGTAAIDGLVPGSSALNVVGANLTNRGDLGGPLICTGNAVATASATHFDGSNTVDISAYQPISGALKTWIDGIVAANPPPVETDAGVDEGTDGGAPRKPGGSSPPPDANDATTRPRPPFSSPSDGCSTTGRSDGAGVWLTVIVAFVVARLRRRGQPDA